MGDHSWREFGCRASAEEPRQRAVSHRRRVDLFVFHAPAVSGADLEAAPSVQRRRRRAGDRRALARAGHAAEPPVFQLQLAQRAWRISRLSLVFLYERAGFAFFESSLPARLHPRPVSLFLVIPSLMAFSVERLFSRDCEAVVQASRSRRKNAITD